MPFQSPHVDGVRKVRYWPTAAQIDVLLNVGYCGAELLQAVPVMKFAAIAHFGRLSNNFGASGSAV